MASPLELLRRMGHLNPARIMEDLSTSLRHVEAFEVTARNGCTEYPAVLADANPRAGFTFDQPAHSPCDVPSPSWQPPHLLIGARSRPFHSRVPRTIVATSGPAWPQL